MATLISKPGINSSTAGGNAVPKDWSQSWFRGFISDYLKGADVRNAVGANGIVVSGNITSPYATISLGGTGPIVLTNNVTLSPSARVPLTINAPAGSTGEVINAPPNGQALIANGAANTINAYVVAIQSGTVAGVSSGLEVSAGTNSSDTALLIRNAATTRNYLQVRGDGQSLFTPSSGIAPINLVNGGAATDAFAFGTNYFSTGAAAPVLTANKPGSLTSVLGWVQVLLNGTVGWVPVWNN